MRSLPAASRTQFGPHRAMRSRCSAEGGYPIAPFQPRSRALVVGNAVVRVSRPRPIKHDFFQPKPLTRRRQWFRRRRFGVSAGTPVNAPTAAYFVIAAATSAAELRSRLVPHPPLCKPAVPGVAMARSLPGANTSTHGLCRHHGALQIDHA